MRYRVLLAAFLCMAVLAGCSGKKVNLANVTESTVGINADGSVDEVVIESFDKDYYSLEELTDFVNEAVAVFNEANPQEQPENQKNGEAAAAITVQAVEENEDEKTARMALSYLNTDIYNGFNGTGLQFMSVEEAASEDSIAGTDLISVKTGEPAAFGDLAGSEKLYVVCTSESLQIRTSGRIVYYSEAASLIDDHTVSTAEGQSVIVFK